MDSGKGKKRGSSSTRETSGRRKLTGIVADTILHLYAGLLCDSIERDA